MCKPQEIKGLGLLAPRLRPCQSFWAKLQGLCRCPRRHLPSASQSTRYWLHNTSTDSYSHFYPHQKRGGEALDEIGILSGSQGILCHDHWKPYFNYGTAHALCNAHHLRELERAAEQDGQKWAKQMSELLLEINRAVDEAGGSLDPPGAELFRQRYREVLTEAEIECPEPKKKAYHLKPGRIARS
ncbi:MAG: transposase, partial [Desulfoprunum sp.]|uniref:IS66 family transposase n=1 Tax=Desulfoprunum sp. TaxID=2020866 RepID=UPI003C761F6A